MTKERRDKSGERDVQGKKMKVRGDPGKRNEKQEEGSKERGVIRENRGARIEETCTQTKA